MSAPITVIRRVIAVLKLSANAPQFISNATTIVAAIASQSSTFPSPQPALSTVTTHINNLDAKQIRANTRASGAAGARDAAKNIVAKDLRKLLAYVQDIADNNPEQALEIILKAGMKVKGVSTRAKAEFAAKHGQLPGSIILIAKAGELRSSHDWQSSPNGTVWTPLPNTIRAKTTVSGLTTGSRMYFRHRLVTKDGPALWSQTWCIMVL